MIEILPVKRMRQYELTFLVPSGLTSTEIKKTLESIQSLVEKHKGKITSQEEWGKRTLAYTIKKGGKRYTEANYYHWLVEIDAKQVPALERSLVLSLDILRSLLLVADPETIRISQLPERERSDARERHVSDEREEKQE